MVGQGLAVGAGEDCSDTFLLSSIISLFFLPLSGMDGWVTCGSTEILVISERWVGDGWLYVMESRLRFRRPPPQAGLESGTGRSAGHRLTELPGDGSI